MTRRITIISILILIGLSGGWLFGGVEIKRQAAIARGLFSAAMALFAILGVWIAVLDPSKALDDKPEYKPSERERLAKDLLYPWLFATVLFGAAFVLSSVLCLLPPETENPMLLVTTGGIISILSLLILYAFIGTMLPIARLRYFSRERDNRYGGRKNK